MSFEISGRRTVAAGAAAVLAMLACAALPGVAAARRPVITHGPAIAGDPVSGKQLTAVEATWQSKGETTATYGWARCADPGSWRTCHLIDGAGGTAYTLTDADVGQHVLVWLRVTNPDGSATAISPPTAAVAAKPAPAPEPAPEPSPQPSGSPAPPVSGQPPAPVTPAGGVAGGEAVALRWLSPFPVVRIKGWLTASGARVTLLTVRAPRGARVRVRCTGSGCPRKRYARATRLIHLRPYERVLRGNLRLRISVTRAGFVGKRTIITLRRGKAPARRDLCLYPGARRARSCASP